MPIHVLALTTVNPENPEALSAYIATTTPLLEQAGAEIIMRYYVVEEIVGTQPAKVMTIVRYPDRAAVDHVFKHAEYGALRDIRDAAFLEYQINIVDTHAE